MTDESLRLRVEALEKRFENETKRNARVYLVDSTTSGEQVDGDATATTRINMQMVQALGTATMSHHGAQRNIRDLAREIAEAHEPTDDLAALQRKKLQDSFEEVDRLRKERDDLEKEIQSQPWFDSVTAAAADRAALDSERGAGPYVGDEASVTAGLLRLSHLKREQGISLMLDRERL